MGQCRVGRRKGAQRKEGWKGGMRGSDIGEGWSAEERERDGRAWGR